jgi:hypothetical protein
VNRVADEAGVAGRAIKAERPSIFPRPIIISEFLGVTRALLSAMEGESPGPCRRDLRRRERAFAESQFGRYG